MNAHYFLPLLALAIPGAFGQFSVYGHLTAHPHAGDIAPDLTFTKTLSFPISDSWSPSNLSGQLTVLIFMPDTTHNPQLVTQWNDVVDKFAGKPVEFVWITGECECTLLPWLQQHPIKGWVLHDPGGKTGNAYGLQIPVNVIVGTDRKIVGFFMGIQEAESLVQATQDGRITTTPPTSATLKAFSESKQVLIDAKPFTFPRVENLKPNFPPSYAVHVSPSQGEESGNFSSDDYWSLQGITFKGAIEMLYDANPIRIELPASLDTNKHYNINIVLPQQESREQMKDRIGKGLQDYFHVNVSREDRLVDVYILALSSNGKRPSAWPRPDEGATVSKNSGVGFEPPANVDEALDAMKPQPLGAIRSVSVDGTADEFCHRLEALLDRPVVNETDLQGEFEFRVESSEGPGNSFLDRLRSQLGLVITPAQRNVETLVFDPR